jgi:hypothetical protein
MSLILFSGEMNCEACRRWNHPAKWQVTLEGVPYDPTAYWKGQMKVCITYHSDFHKNNSPIQFTFKCR